MAHGMVFNSVPSRRAAFLCHSTEMDFPSLSPLMMLPLMMLMMRPRSTSEVWGARTADEKYVAHMLAAFTSPPTASPSTAAPQHARNCTSGR